jgi:hypothetical protein
MKLDSHKSKIVKSQDFRKETCKVRDEDWVHIQSLLRDNYSYPILATIREIIANAWDANEESGSKRNIFVQCPTKFEPTFIVRDYGKGLPSTAFNELYNFFGASTKRGDNTGIGGFGIGRFSPLSFVDGFDVVSYHDGKAYSWHIFKNEDGANEIVEIGVEDTTEHNGLKVSVPIPDNSIKEFSTTLEKFLVLSERKYDFNKEIKFNPDFQKSEHGFLWWKSSKEEGPYYNASVFVRMGGILYPLDEDAIGVGRMSVAQYGWSTQNTIVFDLPIGSVPLHHSRESLEYNGSTKKFLKDHVKSIIEKVSKDARKETLQSDCITKAHHLYYDKIKTHVLKDWMGLVKINYKGVDIATWNHKFTPAVERSYQCHYYCKQEMKWKTPSGKGWRNNDLAFGKKIRYHIGATISKWKDRIANQPDLGEYIYIKFQTEADFKKFCDVHNTELMCADSWSDISSLPLPKVSQRAAVAGKIRANSSPDQFLEMVANPRWTSWNSVDNPYTWDTINFDDINTKNKIVWVELSGFTPSTGYQPLKAARDNLELGEIIGVRKEGRDLIKNNKNWIHINDWAKKYLDELAKDSQKVKQIRDYLSVKKLTETLDWAASFYKTLQSHKLVDTVQDSNLITYTKDYKESCGSTLFHRVSEFCKATGMKNPIKQLQPSNLAEKLQELDNKYYMIKHSVEKHYYSPRKTEKLVAQDTVNYVNLVEKCLDKL